MCVAGTTPGQSATQGRARSPIDAATIPYKPIDDSSTARPASVVNNIAAARGSRSASPRRSSTVLNVLNGSSGSTSFNARCISAATPATGRDVRTIQLGENQVCTVLMNPSLT
jgi:hypothetical protein